MTNDMTIGNSSKILFYFAMPMVLGNIFQQFYTIIDSVVVGNFVGANALAAVGASYPITFVFITIANGASIGCAVVISQLFGAKYMGKMKTAIHTSLISIGIFSTILMILGLASSNAVLNLLKTPSDIFDDANIFMKIYFMGVVFLFLYNITNSAFNALGNSKTPLGFLIFSTFLNIGLDLLFVIKFNMGVKGVAYATLISQGMAAFLSLGYLLKEISKIKVEAYVRKDNISFKDLKVKINKFSKNKNHMKFNYEESKTLEEYKVKWFDFNILKSMCKIAVPSIIQQSIVSVGNLFVQALVNGYGSIVIAGYAAATKIDSITIMPMSNLSNAVSTFTAQNIGAKKEDRVKGGYKSALIMIGIFCACIAFILFVYGKNFIGMFVDSNSNQGVIDIGAEYLRVVSLFYFFMGLMVVTNGVLRGAGDIKAFLTSTVTNLSTRIIFAYGLAFLIGQKAIWWAVPLGWIFASTVSIIRYKSGKWKNKKCIST